MITYLRITLLTDNLFQDKTLFSLSSQSYDLWLIIQINEPQITIQ